ncbi:hypothetical protein [Cesiribacter andamanensis]|nr:hypothetical protein [Cesiribacter andamanensis]
MFCRSNVLLLLFSLMAATGALAQVGQSPYTVRGIGNINSMATARNMGMGGVGIGNTHPLFISIQNPAMLGYNAYYTTALAGFSVESRRLATTDTQDRLSSGGFDYLAVAFPLLRNKMALNIGLSPYSTVSYNLQATEPVQGLPNSNATVLYQGSGGLTQAYAATGINIYKGLTIGGRVSYVFGNITNEVSTTMLGDTVAATTYTAYYLNRTSFSDFMFTGGIGYRKDLNTERQTYIMGGISYELEASLNAKRFYSAQRLQGAGNSPIYSDTIANNYPGKMLLPAAIGAGVSFGRLWHYMVGADVRLQNWEQYQNFEQGNNEGMGNSYRVALGGEWTPDYFSRNYFSRITYRTGVQAEKTPFRINGEQINEFGINFGVTFPVGASGVHTSFLLGQRGKTENDLIRERFFRINLGVTLNERWFERYRYD